MADIGSLLLPDINLMQGYEQSFQRQQALKQYIVQKSDKDEDRFYKEATFTPDDAIGVVRGQQDALIGKLDDYKKKMQEAYGDMKHGAMFRIDPKRMAELQGERLKLEAEQSQRLQSIKNLSTAAVIMRKPGAEGLYDVKAFEDYKNRIQKGEFVDPQEEALVHLPTDGTKMLNDVFKGQKPETIYSQPSKSGHTVNQTETQYLPSISGNGGYNEKTYKQQGYDWVHSQMMAPNSATAWSIGKNFELFARDNPQEAKSLIKDHGEDAPWILFSTQHKADIEAKILGAPKQVKPRYYEGSQGSSYAAEREQARRERYTLSAIDPLKQVYSAPPKMSIVGANIGKDIKGKDKQVNGLIQSIDRKNEKINIVYLADDGTTQLNASVGGDDYIRTMNELKRQGYGFDEGVTKETPKTQPTKTTSKTEQKIVSQSGHTYGKK